jgi:ATP-binding cassette subfamily B protein
MARARDNIPDRPASKNLRHLAALAGFLRPYRLQIALAFTALVLAAGCVLVLGQGLRQVIDHGIGSGSEAMLDHTLFGLLAVICVLTAATYGRYFTVSWIGERVTADIRRAVFGHLLRLPPGYFETVRTGEVISRLTNDTALLEIVIGSSASLAARNLLLLMGSLAMLLVTSAKLTALVLVSLPLVILPILMFGRRVRRLARATQDRVAEVSSYIDEALHEIRTLQAYVHEAVDRQLFGERVESAFGTALERIRQRAALVGMVIFLAFGSVGVILWIGGHDVLAGRLTAGQLSAFVFYSVLMAGAVGAVSEVIGDLQRAAGATERLMDLFSSTPQIDAPEHPQALPEPPRGEIELQAVLFHYPSRPDAPALDRVSLRVGRGERVALVGPSGAGKSTVFQLLLRFYDVSDGVIRVDGVDVRAADPRDLRKRFAMVPQDPVIFAASVIDNVRYARPEASDAQVRAACEAAYAMEFIERLPEGFGTFLGERGVRLSGGQRQRLSIARALLADRPILLLDEATSSLDAESEHFVQRALDVLMRGRTTLIIAHRLATVRSANRIVVFEQGRILAQGTHEALVRDGGLYARLAGLQFIDAAA